MVTTFKNKPSSLLLLSLKYKRMLKDRTILITGGGSGIGEALATILSAENKVIINGRNEEKLKKASAAGKHISYYVADLSKPDEIDGLFKRLKADNIVVDVLINNAGVTEPYYIDKKVMTSSQIFEKINTNLSGAIATTQQFIAQADRAASNLIVNISSAIVVFPAPSQLLYFSSKSGLHAFTRLLRYQLKDTNFKVVEVLPQGVDTEMSRGLGFTGKAPLPSTYARKVIRSINKGKIEHAFAGITPARLFNALIPNATLRLVDKMSQKLFKHQ